MIKRERYKKRDLPLDAEFLLGHMICKIENNILHSYQCDNGTWYSTDKTLEEYNVYYVHEDHELSIYQLIQRKFKKEYDKNYYFYYDELTDKFYVSYNRPTQKGYKMVDGVKKARIVSGERFELEKNLPISKYISQNRSISLYELEKEVCGMFGYVERNTLQMQFYDGFHTKQIREKVDSLIKESTCDNLEIVL